MPDLWLDVDVALAEVPVNILPLIDDTDFKSRETAIVYNQAGMDLVWNFVTAAGAMTQTAVTPTDGTGDYDWVHQGDGMYSIEIPASGGASINNDTEGFGWFTGICTGVLPWRGPTIGFRAAGLNDKLIDSAYDTTRGLAGTALPGAAADAAGGLPISDAGALDVDAQRADVAAILVDTGTTLDGRIPAALVSGKMDASVGAIVAAALAQFFSVNSGTTYGAAVAGSVVKEIADNAGSTPPTAGAIADAVWDEARAGHVAAGSFGEGVATVQGNVTGSLGSLAAQAKADVNAEVLDVLNTDTFAEPGQAAPGATVSLVTKLGYLYKAWRNRRTDDGATVKLYADDAATVDQKYTVTDDTLTFDKGEVGTGP